MQPPMQHPTAPAGSQKDIFASLLVSNIVKPVQAVQSN